jgi:hypothetical protein
MTLGYIGTQLPCANAFQSFAIDFSKPLILSEWPTISSGCRFVISSAGHVPNEAVPS